MQLVLVVEIKMKSLYYIGWFDYLNYLIPIHLKSNNNVIYKIYQ